MTLVPPVLPWLLGLLLVPAGKTLGQLVQKWALRWLPAVMLVALTAAAGTPALAGWFTRGPDPKTEAANRVLERAATIAAEAAAVQTQDHRKMLEAVTALSSERTFLAAQLSSLGKLAARDAAWAAAIETSGPVLVAVAVLAVGGVALWMVTRTSEQDSQLASVLVDEIAGDGAGVGLLGPRTPPAPKSPGLPRAGHPRAIDIYPGSKETYSPAPDPDQPDPNQYPNPTPETQEGELPF
jgi:hypothetical protein